MTSETTGILQALHIWNSVSGRNSQRIWGRFVIWCHETSSFVRTSAEIQVASTVVWTELLWRSWIHGRFMRIILETYIIWIKVPKKFQVINFPIFSKAKKDFLFVKSSSISTAIQQLSPSCPGLPRTIFSQVENGAPGSSSWAPLFWKHQTVRGILRSFNFSCLEIALKMDTISLIQPVSLDIAKVT